MFVEAQTKMRVFLQTVGDSMAVNVDILEENYEIMDVEKKGQHVLNQN
jgi:hypothetical protein